MTPVNAAIDRYPLTGIFVGSTILYDEPVKTISTRQRGH
jgi:hypothetical protein